MPHQSLPGRHELPQPLPGQISRAHPVHLKPATQMAQMNHHLSGVETIFIPTSSKYSFIASKLVREVAHFGGDVSAFVPKVVAEHLVKKFEGKDGKEES